jgi:hypothetical protein
MKLTSKQRVDAGLALLRRGFRAYRKDLSVVGAVVAGEG